MEKLERTLQSIGLVDFSLSRAKHCCEASHLPPARLAPGFWAEAGAGAAPKTIARAAANLKLKPLFSSKVGLLAAYKLNKIPWPQKAEVATAPAPPPKDYR